MVSLSDNEEQVFKKTVEWLSDSLNSTPILLKQQEQEFCINPITRTYTKANRKLVYLTSK